jgi:subtilisin family serine protease
MKLTKYTPSDYLKDNHGHGTHIAGLIAKYAGDSDYCLLIAKYYDPKAKVNDNLLRTRQALEWAIKRNIDIINYSGGGSEKSEEECIVIKKALDKGIIVVTAAGNERSNLDETPYYPAMCDSRVTMVANLDVFGGYRGLASTSNYNSEVVAVQGTKVKSIFPNERTEVMSGTSQATAIVTGRLVKLLNQANIKRSNNDN